MSIGSLDLASEVASYGFLNTAIFQKEESPGFSESVRNRAKELAKTFDAAYLELSFVFYKISEEHEGEDGKRTCLYKQWGYQSLGDYSEAELNVHRRKAERLRLIWAVVFQKLEISSDLRKRLIDLGVSRLRELVRVLTNENVLSWVDTAERSTYDTLAKLIGKAKDSKRKNELISHVEATEAESVAYGASFDSPMNELDEHSDSSIREDVFAEDRMESEELTGSAKQEAPKVEECNFMQFALYPAQELNVLYALECAEKLSKSNKKGNLLDLICLDFLATNDFASKRDQKQVIATYLSKIEALLGVKLVAFKPETQEPVYGARTLERLADLANASVMEAAE